MSPGTGAVLVGVDGSPGATRAAVWAAGEAARRHRALRVLSVLPAHGVRSDFLADDAAEEARRAVPDLEVSPARCEGDPVEVLLEAGRDAEVLVVGRGGRGAVAERLLGSVATEVAARGVCPTVVVPGAPAATGPIVVGVDGTPSSEAAIGFAVAAADRDGVPLVAVHVWRDLLDDPEWPTMVEDDPEEDATPEEELLAERLAGWRARYPDVEVVRRLPEGRPARTLVDLSAGAGLLVVGTRGRRGLAAAVGSVGRAVLARAHCPVAVVPPCPSG